MNIYYYYIYSPGGVSAYYLSLMNLVLSGYTLVPLMISSGPLH